MLFKGTGAKETMELALQGCEDDPDRITPMRLADNKVVSDGIDSDGCAGIMSVEWCVGCVGHLNN